VVADVTRPPIRDPTGPARSEGFGLVWPGLTRPGRRPDIVNTCQNWERGLLGGEDGVGKSAIIPSPVVLPLLAS
jgi:hypothetical protein